MISDNTNTTEVKNNVSPFPTALRYGLITGTIVIFIILGLHFFTTNLVESSRVSRSAGEGIAAGMMMLVIIPITVILGYIAYLINVIRAIRNHRDNELGGIISFSRCLVIGTIIFIIVFIMGTIPLVLLPKSWEYPSLNILQWLTQLLIIGAIIIFTVGALMKRDVSET